MTQKDLNTQRLVKEAEEATTRLHTRKHFLKECAFGFGGLRLVHFCNHAAPDLIRAQPKPYSTPHIRLLRNSHIFQAGQKVLFTCTWQELPLSLSCSTINQSYKNSTGKIVRLRY
jgi:hypothetical protein